ncbi:hypothetical protein E2562_019728 [Oryza meyeriana var. granulata]|uniref:Serine-threonine/tyrosine-protein kinase catalytic domain-containing protein n=1 Tax=Oryza meyeriana var. granulata TaxID=110450 RepID=A0A6G1C802_9ORYZ|nr:hypothetical protein E2562_019728 [Oryza meyeriana var. granulata]
MKNGRIREKSVGKSAKQHNFASYGLAAFAVPLIEAGELRKMLDRRPAAEPTPRQLEAAGLVAQTAARCLRLQWEQQPAISGVVANLEMVLELACCHGSGNVFLM